MPFHKKGPQNTRAAPEPEFPPLLGFQGGQGVGVQNPRAAIPTMQMGYPKFPCAYGKWGMMVSRLDRDWVATLARTLSVQLELIREIAS